MECSIEGCDREVMARGWCRRHYKRWYQHGDPVAGGPVRGGPIEDRFWSKVKKGDPAECWEWTGAKTADGYGLFKADAQKSMMGPHRWSYERYVGPIPTGLQLDHLCRNRACVNPSHLEPVTPGENVRRGDAGMNMRRKTHCPQGHPYAGDNLLLDLQGKRHCRLCRREAVRRYREKTR